MILSHIYLSKQSQTGYLLTVVFIYWLHFSIQFFSVYAYSNAATVRLELFKNLAKNPSFPSITTLHVAFPR